ncbi:MAG TPA: ribonuclease R [Chromatiales bacterium]|nr:ribonuclease R [Thiotrichales bacterium]HIP69364.1 ribonuclease R [Chromatiales bacterium]
MSKKKQFKDPHSKREAAKYENPIASRELILEVLGKQGPLNRKELASIFSIDTDDAREGLRRRLRAMERDGQIVQNRRGGYLPLKESDLIRGRVIAHPDGFGFLANDEGGDDLFLSPKQMHKVLHGDRVVVRVVGVDRRGRREAAIVEVLERAHKHIIGRYFKEGEIGFVYPDNKRIHQDILIPPGQEGEAEEGQIVMAAIVEQPTRHSQPIGRITEVIGEHMAPGMEIDVAIRSHELPHEWPAEVLKEIKAFSDEVPEAAKKGRLDLRGVPLVTIDGEDARDFDDAVYCEPNKNGWRLLVAIADVSAYVTTDMELDKAAVERATSVYFPNQVIPMLPEVLSNGLCSINPDIDRLCMVCEMQINKQGEITDYQFHEGLMRSHARLTYTEVAAMVIDKDESHRSTWKKIVPHLENLYALYQVFHAAREKRGAIEFETTETYIEFDSERKISRIAPRTRNDAHRLIEECMIAANTAAARFLKAHEIPSLYRNHEGPKEEKVEDLRQFLSELGLKIFSGKKPSPKDYAIALEKIKGRPDFHLIQTVMLRSLMQAVYSPDTEIGHFGLALEDYAHFTSPIRRYPDLLVHRAIRHILQKKKAAGFGYTTADMLALGEHCSMCERRADDATRDAVDWLKCEYMQDKLGEQYPGIVTTVTSFGLFVELDEIYVEGLVHITSLPHDYYHFDPVRHRLEGKRDGKQYRLGDQIEVIVSRVDLDERKIDFELAGVEKTKKPARKKKGKKKKK